MTKPWALCSAQRSVVVKQKLGLLISVHELKLQYVTKSCVIKATGTWAANVIALCKDMRHGGQTLGP